MTSVFAGRSVDFRVSTVPTQFGESIVCRVLDPHARKLDWDALGFAPDIKRKVIDLIERPSWLFLVTGPTGSGKTTTLYTALAHLNTPERKIITVEDPIEYSVPGIEQVQVNAATGLSFARVLRAVLRQDPDIVMVGEIRDAETAEIACRAALIGRLVLSTLHTRSADAAVTRLVDLGVERYLVEDVLIGVLGQRLNKEAVSTATMPNQQLRRQLQLDLMSCT
ncbi:MAG: ATPase, T2SS/T4P/T4SS family [Pseudomonadota bacterium]